MIITEELYKNNLCNVLENTLDKLNNINKTTYNTLQHSAFNHIKSAVIDLINLYGLYTSTNYNKDKVSYLNKKVHENKQTIDHNKSVTVVMTTCKRYDLFHKTIDSFIEMCQDLDKYVTDFIVIDDQSSDEDIDKMTKMYPFLKIIRKPIELKGHAKSMNMLHTLITTPYFIILEDDWEFVIADNYITKCFDILDNDSNIGQALLNLNYAEDFTIGSNIQGAELKKTSSGQNYYLHRFDNTKAYEYPNCHYWPHFSFRVGLTRTEILNKIGKFSEEPIHFEMEFAHRYQKAGFKTAFLNSIVAYHTGRRTYERSDNNKLNAYDLNRERQFGEKLKEIDSEEDLKSSKEVPNTSKEDLKSSKEDESEERNIGTLNGKPLIVKTQFNIKSFVINLKKRPQRLYRFMKQLPLANYIHTFDGVDGTQIKPNQKIQKLFSTGDYNYRRGIIGCALSHLTIWQEILNSVNIDYLLIFEDDAILVDDFNTKLLHLLETYHNKFDVLYLGMFPYPNKDRKEWHYTESNVNQLPTAREWNKSEMFATSMGGNHGYLISRKGVLNILEYLDKNGMTNAVDWMVMHTARNKFQDDETLHQKNIINENRIFYCEPFIVEGDCYQSSNKSDYQTDIQLDYNSIKLNDTEFFDEELKYWKNKSIDKLCISSEESISKVSKEIINNNIVFCRHQNEDNKILDKYPIKYYTVSDWIISVPEYLLTKEILEDKTFGGYLNKKKFY